MLFDWSYHEQWTSNESPWIFKKELFIHLSSFKNCQSKSRNYTYRVLKPLESYNLTFNLIVNSFYSKALRWTFFWERKNSCSSKLVQLLLLNRVKTKRSKKPCCSRFSLHKFVQINFFGPNSKTCTCKVRVAWGRVSRGPTVFAKWSILT